MSEKLVEVKKESARLRSTNVTNRNADAASTLLPLRPELRGIVVDFRHLPT